MFTVLNRLRGTWGWMAKVIAVLIGTGFYILTGDLYTSIGLVVAYIAGESFGWGKWIGGVFSKNEGPPTIEQLNDLEGRDNGIHWLANKISSETENYYRYCYVALSLRGALWFLLLLLPLVVIGYIEVSMYIVSILLLGIGFPISVDLGAWTSSKFRFKFMGGYWEHAEVWYGLIQDIIFILILLNIK